MKKLLVLTAALLTFAAAASWAQPVPTAGGIDLTWAFCATAAPANKAYACDFSGATATMQSDAKTATASMTGSASDGLSGATSIIDALFAGGSVPQYWGNCSTVSASLPNNTPPCPATNLFAPATSFASATVTPVGPDRLHIQIDAVSAASPHDAFPANTLEGVGALTLNEGLGDASGCAGCATAGCFVCNSVELVGYQGEDFLITGVDVRNYVTWQGGAVGGAGCPAATPSHSSTWGAVKALYR